MRSNLAPFSLKSVIFYRNSTHGLFKVLRGYGIIFTHLENKVNFLSVGSLTEFERGFHELIDDTNYRFDNKYLKNNLKSLEKNLKWLKKVNSLEKFVNPDALNQDCDQLLAKLHTFNSIPFLQPSYTFETLYTYLTNKYELLQSLVPLLNKSSDEFRRRYVITNPLIQHLIRLLSSNFDTLPSNLLVKYFDFLLKLDLDDISHLVSKTYCAIYNSLDREDLEYEDKLDMKFKLLCTIDKFDGMDLDDKIQQLLLTSLGNGIVFYNNFKEMVKLIYYSFSNKTISNDYVMNWVMKLNDYVYLLPKEDLINSLYLLLKVNYVDEVLFNKVVESLIYKLDDLSFDEMEVLVSILCSYKCKFVLVSPDLGESIYTEQSRFLLSMVREYFEGKLVHLRLTRLLEPLSKLTMLTKSKKIKSLVLKKLDSSLVSELTVPNMNRLMVLLSNLNVNKNHETVSQMIKTYISNNLLQTFMSERVIDEDMEGVLKLLDRFVSKKYYHKFLNQFITEYNQTTGDCNGKLSEYVFLLSLSKNNRGNCVNKSLIGNIIDSGKVVEMDMDKLCVLLQGVKECDYDFEQVLEITEDIFNTIYKVLKSKARWNLRHTCQILDFITSTRIVPRSLTNLILQYVQDNYNFSKLKRDANTITFVNDGIINLCVLYLKCVVVLDMKLIEDELENLYTFSLSYTNSSYNSVLSKHVKEMLLLEKYRNFNLYERIMEKLDPEVVNEVEKCEVFKPCKGKLHSGLKDKISADFIPYYQFSNIVFDYYSEKQALGIQIVKTCDYYKASSSSGGEIHWKFKPFLFKKICSVLNINLKQIPQDLI